MSGYNTHNFANFNNKPIYAQVAPNQKFGDVEVNNLKVDGTISSNGPLTVQNLNVTNSLTAQNGTLTNLTVNGSSTFNGLLSASNESISGFLSVAGPSALNGGVSTTQLQATSVTSTSSTVNGQLSVNGNANVSGILSAGTLNISSQNVSGPLTVSGLSSLNGGVSTTTITASGLATLNGGVSTTLLKASDMTGGNLYSGNGAIENLATQKLTVGFDGAEVVGNGYFWQNIYMTGSLTSQGNVNATNLTASNAITASGLATLNGGINTTGIVSSGDVIAPNITALLNDAGFGQTISANVPALETAVATAVANTHFGAFIHGGNVKSNQSFFASAGICNANTGANSWSPDTLMNYGSAGKLLTGLIFAKMQEEGLVSASDKCSLYLPAMTGTGLYYTNITVTDLGAFPLSATAYTGAFPYNPAVYTATTGAFLWQDVTINDLLHYDIGIIQDAFAVGAFTTLFQNPDTITAVVGTNYKNNAASNPIPAGCASLLQYNKIVSSAVLGTPITPVTQVALGSNPLTTLVPSAFDNLIALNRNGILIAGNKPGTLYQGMLPYGVTSSASQYDIGYQMLGAVIDQALRAKGYTNGYAQYARAKFFTPMGMNDSYVLLQESIPDSKKPRLAGNSWRRAPTLGLTQTAVYGTPQTYPGWGVSTAYQSLAGFSGTGPLVWDSQYPTDSISRYAEGAFYCLTGTSTNYPLGNSPIITSIADFGKMVQLVANRGSFNGQRILKTETWNYLVQPKLQATTALSNLPYPAGNDTFSSWSYCLGIRRYNRDLASVTTYGVDETTCFNSGITGNFYALDFYTGNWFMVGVPEASNSSGNLLGTVGGTLYGIPVIPSVYFQPTLVAMIN